MKQLPTHIAIICDGNRRWAKRKGQPEFSGHCYAVETTVENLVDHCLKLKIPYLTLWVLSTENWKRGEKWMKQYFKLMKYFMKKKLALLTKKGAKITYIGDLSSFPKDLQADIQQVVKDSSKNTKMTINIAINYGGQDEIIRAINKYLVDQGPFLKRKLRGRTLKDSSPTEASDPKKLTSKDFEAYLDTKNLPNPDLTIRTGDKNQRLSNFMLWQLAYTQLYFTETLFPDLTPEKLNDAIHWWRGQSKNLGK